MQTVARWLSLIVGILNILLGLLFLGPTGVKDTFFKLMVMPKVERAHQLITEGLKVDEAQSLNIKKAVQMMMTTDFITFFISFSIALIALGVALIAFSRTIKKTFQNA